MTGTPRGARRDSGSLTVRKALLILCQFLDAPDIGVSETARRLGMDKSTVFRLLATLQAHTFVTTDPTTKRYRLGPMVLHLSAVLYDQLDLRRVALPVMHRLRKACQETLTLEVRFADVRVCVEQLPSLQPIRRVVEIGQRLPLYAGASGKLLLAFSDDAEALLSRLDFKRLTRRTPRTAEVLRQEIEEIRASGYAVSVDEVLSGVSGIAVPVRDYRGRVIASLAASGPSGRLTRGKMERLSDQMIAGAATVSTGLGHRQRGPGPAVRSPSLLEVADLTRPTPVEPQASAPSRHGPRARKA